MAFSCRDKTKCLWRHRTGCRNYLNLPFCPSLMGTQLQHFKNEASSLGERKSLFSTSTDYKRSKLISSLKRTARKEKAVNYVQGWLVLSRWSCFQTWPQLCMVQWGLAVTWEMPWAHSRPDTIGFFTIWSMGKWGFCQNNIPLKEVTSDKSSLSGASLRAPSPDKSAFALCIWCITSFQTAPFTNCALCYHYSFIQGLSWWNRHPPASSLITLSQSDEDIFYLTSCFHQRWQKEKRKTKRSHTHTLLHSAQKILHGTIYHLFKDNHEDEQNHQDRRKSNTLF